jgi:hypothetical protein
MKQLRSTKSGHKSSGLIEGMIDKLLKQAQDEATHEAFCQEETKKSAASRDKKSATADKIQARIDQAKVSIWKSHLILESICNGCCAT